MGGITIKVVVVTDATSSISPELARELNIAVVPVPIQFGPTTFMDGIDPPTRFYELLRGGVLPTTSTPSPGAFLELYRDLGERFDEIVSVHVMSTKSAICQSARIAAEMLPNVRIHIVDSGQVSYGLGLLVAASARLAQQGRSASDIVQWLERVQARTDVFAAIRELTMLRRSGRVGLGKALIAGFLDIKPVLHVRDGVIEVCAQVRSWQRAVDRLVELAQQTAAAASDALQVAIVHTNAPEEAEGLLAALRRALPQVRAEIAEAGPALASHAGPGAVGVCLLRT